VTALLLLLAACGTSASVDAPDAVPAFGAQKWTQSHQYQVSLTLDPDPPPMSELFAVQAVLLDRVGDPIEDATVSLNAQMPQHGHGMMTSPRDEPGADCDASGVCTHAGGVYRTTGFKFHMAGAWTVTADIVGPNGRDDVSFLYEMP